MLNKSTRAPICIPDGGWGVRGVINNPQLYLGFWYCYTPLRNNCSHLWIKKATALDFLGQRAISLTDKTPWVQGVVTVLHTASREKPVWPKFLVPGYVKSCFSHTATKNKTAFCGFSSRILSGILKWDPIICFATLHICHMLRNMLDSVNILFDKWK